MGGWPVEGRPVEGWPGQLALPPDALCGCHRRCRYRTSSTGGAPDGVMQRTPCRPTAVPRWLPHLATSPAPLPPPHLVRALLRASRGAVDDGGHTHQCGGQRGRVSQVGLRRGRREAGVWLTAAKDLARHTGRHGSQLAASSPAVVHSCCTHQSSAARTAPQPGNTPRNTRRNSASLPCRHTCTVVAPQSRRKSAGVRRGRTMQRTS